MRLNIKLPNSLADDLKDKPNKSRYITEVLREKLRKGKQAVLLRELQEGYGATRQEDAELNKEWVDAAEG